MKMLKPLILTLSLLVATLSMGAIIGCSQDSTTPANAADAKTSSSNMLQGLAVVDRATIFGTTEAGKVAGAYLKEMATKLDKQFADYKATIKNGDSVSKRNLQTRFDYLQGIYRAEEAQVNQALETLYQSALGATMTTENVQVVLDKSIVQAYRNPFDISTKVIAEMNKTKLSFTPLKVPAVPKEEAMAAPKDDAPAKKANNPKKR